MTKPNSTDITFIIDRSGSMGRIEADMKGGFDTFIRDQRQVPGECYVSLVRFNERYEEVFTRLPLASVPSLELNPSGNTALLDAVGRTLIKTGTRLKEMPEHQRPSQVLIVTVTDGEENASREFTYAKISEMIKHQTLVYKWDFSYLGANQNAFLVAKQMGMPTNNAVNYDANAGGAAAVWGSLSAGSSNYRRSGRSGGQSISNQQDYDALKGKK